METISEYEKLDARLAERLRTLRRERGWSLDMLASMSGVSRATLSRLENAEVSGTANVLGRLCAAYGITLSRLMLLAESDFAARVACSDQPVWIDPETGFRRRSVSPPSPSLSGEVLEGSLPPGAQISYPAPPSPGLEHHLVMREGRLLLTVEGDRHDLTAGDCLRYRLFGSSAFETPDETGARYLLFLV